MIVVISIREDDALKVAVMGRIGGFRSKGLNCSWIRVVGQPRRMRHKMGRSGSLAANC